MAKSYPSLRAMQDDLGGNYTTAAVRNGRFYAVKDLNLVPRNCHTPYHERAARERGYRIVKGKRQRIKTYK